jgi:cytochrome c553
MAAATAVSQMARICGDCHLAYGVQLEFGYDSLPSEDLEDVVTHMQRHLWAVDRLWEGLIGPSDRAWNRGADMLVDEPLTPDDVTITIEQHAEISNITRRIHAPGGISAATVTPDARSGLFGEVLGLCAGCHVMLGRGPANQ